MQIIIVCENTPRAMSRLLCVTDKTAVINSSQGPQHLIKRFSPEGHSLNKQLRDQSFTPIHPNDMKRESSSSPTFNEQLEIAPQLS